MFEGASVGSCGRNKLRPSRREGDWRVNGSLHGVAATGETTVSGASGGRALPAWRNLAVAQERNPHAGERSTRFQMDGRSKFMV